MTLTDVKTFYGGLDVAAKAIDIGKGILGFTEHLSTNVQMRFFVASKGKLALDETLAALIADVIKTTFLENEE